jgi:hypothetical protein
MLRHAQSLNRLILVNYLTPFALLLWSTQALAHTDSDESFPEYASKWSYQVGVDTWKLKSSTDKDTDPGYINESSALLLPNAYTKWQYSDVSTYGWVQGQKLFTKDTSANLKVRVDQTLGWRIDEAQLKTDFSPSLGIRYGVVDYKTSWCRNYDSDNMWIREVETICSTPQFRDVTGGSPGVQLFTNVPWGNYLMQTQIGFYSPLTLRYAPKEFGNLVPSNNYQVLTNKKMGMNFNLINLVNSLEVRVSYIRGHQKAHLPELDLNGDFVQSSDMLYIGLSLPITKKITGRFTHFVQTQLANCRSQVAKFASACNLNLTFDKYASSAEMSYRLSESDVLSIGLNRTGFEINQDLFTQQYDAYSADITNLRVKQQMIAWRHDWNKGIFSVMQWMKSEQISGQRDVNIGSNGSAAGIRVGYQY